MKTLHILGILLITCTIILLGIYLFREGFDNIEKAQQAQFVEDRLKNYNPTGMVLIAASQEGSLGSSTTPLTGTVDRPGVGHGVGPGIGQDSASSRFPLSTGKTGMFATIAKCEAVTTADCSAFDDPNFLQECGICLDIGTVGSNKSLNSSGKESLGGRVLLPADRTFAEADVRDSYLSIPNYTARIGTCLANRLVATKDQCLRLSAELKCNQVGSYDLTNCAQCYSDTSYHVVDPTIYQEHGTLYLTGKGKLVFTEVGFPPKTVTLSTSATVIPLQGPESTRLTFAMEGPDATTKPTIGGYLTGKTPNGVFNIDLYRTIIADTLIPSPSHPRVITTSRLNNIDIIMMGPGFGSSGNPNSKMSLLSKSTFTFIDPISIQAGFCKDTPYITTQAAAELLNSDPCYKKGSGPGKFNFECLQNIFTANGCSESGTGYPADIKRSGELMMNDDGTPRSMTDIADYVYANAIIAATGVDINGQSLSIIPWSKSSMFCTGKSVVTPCDTVSKDTGPLSADCLAYLWSNRGQSNRLGGTYNLLSMATSLFQSGNDKQYCTTSGTKSPYGPDGKPNAANVTYWQGQGGLTAVSKMMDTIHETANYRAGEMLDSDRADYISQCYGSISLARQPGPSSATNSMCPTSGCGTMGRYVRFWNNCDYIHTSQIAVYDIMGNNLARNGIVTMSPEIPAGWGTTLDSVIDGNLLPTHVGIIGNNRGCTFLEIDLGQQYDIMSIVFYQQDGRNQTGGSIAVTNTSAESFNIVDAYKALRRYNPSYRGPTYGSVLQNMKDTEIKSFPITSKSTKLVFNLQSLTPDPGCSQCIATCSYPSGSDNAGVCGTIIPKCPLSGCGIMARYVTFLNNGNYIQTSQIEVYDSIGNNVARNSKLNLAGVYPGWNTKLNDIIDGNLSPTHFGMIGHTMGSAHITMDLGYTFDIVKIVFYQTLVDQTGGSIALSTTSIDVDPKWSSIKSFPITKSSTNTFDLTKK